MGLHLSKAIQVWLSVVVAWYLSNSREQGIKTGLKLYFHEQRMFLFAFQFKSYENNFGFLRLL